ncbi:MAG: hypothetical protein ACXADU_08610 [Promethearchaeota archaeon]
MDECHIKTVSLVICASDKVNLTYLPNIILIEDIGNSLLANIGKYARNEN